jgi:transcriptional regulator with XRE-family HTH domain
MPRASPSHAQDTVPVAFGRAVRQARENAGLSQEAHLAGIDRSYMSSIERGGQNVGMISAARIAQALGMSLAELMLEARL